MEITVWHGITVTTLILNLAILVIGFFIKRWMDNVDKKLEKIEGEYDEIKDEQSKQKLNYIDRFGTIESKIDRTEKNIIKEIAELKDHLADTFVPKDFCRFIQERKK